MHKKPTIPSHVERFLDLLQGQWQTVFRAVRLAKEGARFSAWVDGREREYLVYSIPAGPADAMGIVTEVKSRSRATTKETA